MIVGNGLTNWQYDLNMALPATLGGFSMIPNKWIEMWEQAICKVDINGKITGGDDL